MTLVLATHFQEGLILLADSRATWKLSNGKEVTKDLAQKVFDLTDHIAITFCGDIEFAGIVIRDLLSSIKRKPEYQNIHLLGIHAERILKHIQGQAISVINRKILKTDILLAGSAKQPTSTGDARNSHSFLARYSFGFTPEPTLSVEKIGLGSICTMGSGATLFSEVTIDELIDHNPEYETLHQLNDPEHSGFLRLKARALDMFMYDRIKGSSISTIGGIIQRLTVDYEGIRLGSTWSLNESGKLIFKEGNIEGSWSKFDRTNGTLIKLLECSVIAKTSPFDLQDI